MRSSYSVGGMPFPSSPPLLPPRFVATPTGPIFPASNLNNGSPPGYTIQGTPNVNGAQSPMIEVGEVNNSMSLVPTYPSVRKRKASNSAPSIPSAPKKPHTQSASSMIRDKLWLFHPHPPIIKQISLQLKDHLLQRAYLRCHSSLKLIFLFEAISS